MSCVNTGLAGIGRASARWTLAMLLAVGLATVASGEEPAAAQPDGTAGRIAAMADADPAVRHEAVDALGRERVDSAEAVAALAGALGSEDVHMRWRAARALGAIGPAAAEAVPALVKGLGDKVPGVRAHMIHALGRMGKAAESAVPDVVGMLADPYAVNRHQAVSALRAIAPSPEQVRPLLLDLLSEAKPAAAAHIIESLAGGGKESVPRLIAALEDEPARYWVCIVLAEIGPDAAEAVPALAGLLEDPNPDVRREAVLALAAIGEPAGAAVEAISKRIDDGHPGVRYSAIYLLGKLGLPEGAAAVEKASASDNAFQQLVSAWAKARIHPEDAQVVDAALKLIVTSLESEELTTRLGAARLLCELDASADAIAEAMAGAMDDVDPQVKAIAREAVTQLGAKAVPMLVKALGNEALRDGAVAILGQIGPEAKDAVTALVASLEGADASYCTEVFFTLGQIGPDAAPAVPELIKSLSDADGQVCLGACFALAKIGPAAGGAVDTLAKLHDSDDLRLARASIWALVRIRPDDEAAAARAVPMLIEALTTGVEVARIESAIALGDIGKLAASAKPALTAALEDPSPTVRKAAAEALGKLD